MNTCLKLFLPALFCITTLCAEETKSPSKIILKDSRVSEKTIPVKTTPAKPEEKKLWFKFKDEPLLDIVNYVANAMKINVIPPQGQDLSTTKVTFALPHKLSVNDAYEQLLTLLKMAGFVVIPQNDFYYITKNDKNLTSLNLPLYISTPPNELPDSDQVIKYLYYFANFQIDAQSSIVKLLQDTLSNTTVSGKTTFFIDSQNNALLITDCARNIKSIMELVVELDQFGFTEAVEKITLLKTDATTVATLFKTIIPQADPTGQQVFPQAPVPATNYFSRSLRIIPEKRSNALFIMGKKDAIERTKEFIKNYIDVNPEEGESVLHIYNLQFLKAATFAATLTEIVNAQGNASSSSQSSGSTTPDVGQKYFKGVIITAEATTNAPTSQNSPGGFVNTTVTGPGTPPPPPQQGGNRLIIAAQKDDWKRLQELIKTLDKPQPQVAIEVLIVDLSLELDKTLGSQIRNPQGLFPSSVNFQTSTLGPIIIGGAAGQTNDDPSWNALMANLLQLDNGNPPVLTTNMDPGSFVLSLQDTAATGISWVLQMLNSYTGTKIISQPFIITLNNQPTTFTSIETRLLPGDATAGKGGATIIPLTPVKAALDVALTPMINNSDFINMAITVAINDFQNGSSDTIISRMVQTNANIKDGEILVLGGLTSTATNYSVAGTPFFQDIPFLGWLFKNKSKNLIKSNLVMFMCPRIIKSVNGYSDPYTSQKLAGLRTVINTSDDNKGTLKDPITHWFFDIQKETKSNQNINNFLDRKMFKKTVNYDLLSEDYADRSKPKKTVPMPKTAYKSKKESTKVVKKADPKVTPTTTQTQKTLSKEEQELKDLFAQFDIH